MFPKNLLLTYEFFETSKKIFYMMLSISIQPVHSGHEFIF